jgi:hypothetical protein
MVSVVLCTLLYDALENSSLLVLGIQAAHLTSGLPLTEVENSRSFSGVDVVCLCDNLQCVRIASRNFVF